MQLRTHVLAITLILLIITGCGKDTPTTPVQPTNGVAGKIIYTEYETISATPRIVLIDPDGTNRRDVTVGWLAAVSASGRIMFQYPVSPHSFVLYTMTLDGGTPTLLPASDTALTIGQGALSRDGRMAAYTAYDLDVIMRGDSLNGLLFIQRTDGSDLRQIASNIHFETAPSFSPDGTCVAYVGNDGLLYVIGTDGSGGHAIAQVDNDHRLYAQYNYVTPLWSPDGGRIMIYCRGYFRIVDANATSIDSLRGGVSLSANLAAWSHDGKQVALTLLTSDGRNVQDAIMVTDDKLWDGPTIASVEINHLVLSPTWSPDNASIAFVDADGTYTGSVKVADVATRSIRTVANNANNAYWLPN